MVQPIFSGVSSRQFQPLRINMERLLTRKGNRSCCFSSALSISSSSRSFSTRVTPSIRFSPSASILSFQSKLRSPRNRSFHSSRSDLGDATPTQPPTSTQLPLYQGPLSSVFRRLKLFSLASFGLASALTPVLLLAPADLAMPARIGLAVTALATSGSSTALIAWISGSYVSQMRLRKSYLSDHEKIQSNQQAKGALIDQRFKKAVLDDPISSKSEEIKANSKENDDKVLELLQHDWLLVPLTTTIYQPSFITSTERPFCTWALSTTPPVRSIPSSSSSSSSTTTTSPEQDSFELVIAETRHSKTGQLRGRWIAKWSNETKVKDQQDGAWKSEGICFQKGKVQKYFNVHEELLGDDWKVLG